MLQNLQMWQNFQNITVLSNVANIAETLGMLQMLQSYIYIYNYNVADPTIFLQMLHSFKKVAECCKNVANDAEPTK